MMRFLSPRAGISGMVIKLTPHRGFHVAGSDEKSARIMRVVVQECCGAQERCIWVCPHHHQASATTSRRPPQPSAMIARTLTCKRHKQTTLILRKSARRLVSVRWSCGGAGVLQSSGEVYLGMPAPSSICYDIKTTPTPNLQRASEPRSCKWHKKAPSFCEKVLDDL